MLKLAFNLKTLNSAVDLFMSYYGYLSQFVLQRLVDDLKYKNKQKKSVLNNIIFNNNKTNNNNTNVFIYFS